MVNSMTGYGRGECVEAGKRAVVELKSVNHRFLELSFRLPRCYNMMEEYMRPLLKEKLHRGRVEVYVNLEEEGEKKRNVELDKALVMAYAKSLKELAETMEVDFSFNLLDLATLPEVMQVTEIETNDSGYREVVSRALNVALDQLLEMRSMEGERLTKDLLERNNLLLDLVEEIDDRAPVVLENYHQKLLQRIAEIMADQVDDQRVAMEVALFADRSNVTEEIVRLKSHLLSFSEELQSSSGGPVGRKLDFLIQEINRELNTLGSKGNDLLIAQRVVGAKSEVEKMREQVQNLE